MFPYVCDIFFAPSGLTFFSAPPTACAVGCIISPLRGYSCRTLDRI